MMSVRFLRFCSLPACALPDRARRGPCAHRRRAGALEAGVHVGAVVVADVEHLVAALHGARERLQADVVGAAVAAEGDELDVLVDLALLLEGAEGGLDAAERGGGVLEGGVDEAALPRGVRVDRGRHLEAAGGGAHDDRVGGAHEHLPDDDGRAAAGAHAVAAGELAALGHQLEPLAARLLEVVGLLESVDRTDVDALLAQDAARLVDAERLQGALVEGERAGRAVGDAAAAGDAVGQLQGLAVGRVDVHHEAAAREVVAGRAGDVAADAHALAAGDAAVHVAPDEGVLVLGLDRPHLGLRPDELVARSPRTRRRASAGRRRRCWGRRTAGSASPRRGPRPASSPSRPRRSRRCGAPCRSSAWWRASPARRRYPS